MFENGEIFMKTVFEESSSIPAQSEVCYDCLQQLAGRLGNRKLVFSMTIGKVGSISSLVL